MGNNQASDVHVYRDFYGGAAVYPPIFYVFTEVKQIVVFKNFVADASAVVKIRNYEFTLNRFGEPDDHHSFDVRGLSLPHGIIFYRVTLGAYDARANSSPALIIDP